MTAPMRTNRTRVGAVMARAGRVGLIVLIVAIVVAAAVGLGWAVDDRVSSARRDAAQQRGIGTPAVTQLPAPIADATAVPSAQPPLQSTVQAPMPSAAGVDAALAAVLSSVDLGGRTIGIVQDVQTGAVLLDRLASTLAAPASLAKLATAAAVLSVRDPGDRITTAAVAGAQPGQIVLVGGGDPTLSAAVPGQPTAYPGAARLSELAAAIQASGFGPVTSIVVDSGIFVGSTLGPGWDPADVPTSYGAPITGLMVDGGRDAPGDVQRSAAPALGAGRALAALLANPAMPVAEGAAPVGARSLGTVESAPMLDLVEQMLEQSDNVLADVLARQIAIATGTPASFEGAASATRTVLAGLAVPGLDIESLELVDGSGLSTLDRAAPAALGALLRAAADGAHPRLAPIIGGLPVAGWDGTLADRYPGANPAAGVLRAKTGTLTGVSSLGGVLIDADGRELVFVVIADQVTATGTELAEAALDAVAGTLASCGCP